MITTSLVRPSVPADPISFWRKLHPNPIHGFFLGSCAGSPNDSIAYLSATEPTRVLLARSDGAAGLLEKMRKSFGGGLPVPRFVGFLDFEAGRSFDRGIGRLPRNPNPLQTPGALFGDYDAVVKIDFTKPETILFCRGRAEKRLGMLGRFEEALRARPPHPALSPHTQHGRRGNARTPSLPASRAGGEGWGEGGICFPDQQAFSKMVVQAKKAIARGDIYQANLSLRFEGKFGGDPVSLYRILCKKNPSPYSCLLKCGLDWIVSCSPELLAKVQGRRVITRPIAGTRPRGKTKAIDLKRRGQLLLSPKERAEHVMLVDLERNDLGRVCVPGSVKVTENCSVERYSHVMHIVSQVEGKLSQRRSSVDVLKAVFPGGTITGCPKIKSIEVIERLERLARGPFYGSAGFFCENGEAVFNILIRTALIQKRKVYIQAGAGIVADSQPAREYKEVLAKARVLLEAVKNDCLL